MTGSFLRLVQAAPTVLLFRCCYCFVPLSSSLSSSSSLLLLSSRSLATFAFQRPFQLYPPYIIRSSSRISSSRSNQPAVSTSFWSSTAAASSRHSSAASVLLQQQQHQQHSRLWSSTSASTPTALDSSSQSEATSIVSMMKDTSSSSSSSPEQLPLFAEVSNLHPHSKKALATMGLTRMTEIQARTWEAAVQGKDVLGRARTGTGKTIAFLLPAIERLLAIKSSSMTTTTTSNNNGNRKGRNNGATSTTSVDMLVLSPTRELAAQIADQAEKLLHHNNNGMSVQIMFGGTNRNQDLVKLERKIPTILVSTPGRLKDHLENPSTVKGISFTSLFRNTKVLVLDETDRLLDMGFRRDVETIIKFLPPKQERQTLLFSATLPQEVQQVLQATMKSDYVSVDCIHSSHNNNNHNNGNGNHQDSMTGAGDHTNAQVLQSHVILRSDTNLVTGTVDILLKLLQNNINSNNSRIKKIIKDDDDDDDDDTDDAVKMVVFFSTAKMVAYYASLFNDELKVPVWEIHSRKSQSYRTTASNKFREADRGVLFTSDVSARGVDYPDVTHVVQFGMADSRESYIHRLGRTGRAGKQGEGLLVLCDLEKGFLKQLADIEIPLNNDMQSLVDMPSSSSLARLQPTFSTMKSGKNQELIGMAESAYRAMLGFYNGKLKRVNGGSSTETLVDFANGWALQSGLNEIPSFELRTIRKMGLENAPGIRIEKAKPATKRPPNTSNGAGSSGGRSGQPGRNDRDRGTEGPGAAVGNSNGRQQQQPHNNSRRPANGSGVQTAASASSGARPPQNARVDSTRKRPKQDQDMAQKRPKEGDRQHVQQPPARRRPTSSSGVSKSKGSGDGQRWESADSRRGDN